MASGNSLRWTACYNNWSVAMNLYNYISARYCNIWHKEAIGIRYAKYIPVYNCARKELKKTMETKQ